MERHDNSGFSLIELLVVVIIIGILAAIAIPQFLSQREQARNSAAVSDLRNLVIIEVSLETSATGLTTDADEIADQGWEASDDRIRVCAEMVGADDISLNAWHLDGSRVYQWQRSTSTIQVNDVPIAASGTCADQIGSGVPVWPVP